MKNCDCEKIKKFASENGTTILVSVGIGMISGIAVGMLMKSCMEKEEKYGKKLLTVGLSAVSELLQGISEKL